MLSKSWCSCRNHRKENSAQSSSVIAVANYVWAGLSNFKSMIIGNAFCCFMPGSSFAYPLKVCSNKNENYPYGSLIRLSLKSALKGWDRYPTVSLTVAATSVFFGPCENSACLTSCVKATKMSCLFQHLNTSTKTFLLRSIYRMNLSPFIPSANPLGFGFVTVWVGFGSYCSINH